MKQLDFKQKWASMSPEDRINLAWAIREVGAGSHITAMAWALYLFCSTKVLSKENLAESIRRGESMPKEMISDIAQEIALPKCHHILIGSSGLVVVIRDKECSRIWDKTVTDEQTMFTIHHENLLNMRAIDNN